MTLAGRPISSYQPRTRQPVPWAPRERAIERPPLWEFVFLSLLLHAIAIALFGAPSGGNREGRAMWGALQVVLQGASFDSGPKLRIDRDLGRENPDNTKQPPRPALRTPREQRAVPAAPTLRAEPRIESIVPRVESPPDAAPNDQPLVIPPLLDRLVTPERKIELEPYRVPPPTKAPAAPSPPTVIPAPAPAAAEAPAVVERPAPRVERAPAEAPPIPAPVLQPRVERAVAEPPPVPVPLLQPLTSPPLHELVAAPIIRPVETPVVPAVPITPPVEHVPVEVPAIPAPRIESITPPHSEAATKPVESAPTQEMHATPPVPQREAPARIERAPAVREEPAPRPSPFNAPGASPDSLRSNERAPGSSYDPTAPALDLDAVRKRAGDLARSGTGQRALLPFAMPAVPEKKSKLEAALDKAHKPDCRTAYSSLGLAAVVPLVANEFGEGTCKW
jgi:hypothetical protein